MNKSNTNSLTTSLEALAAFALKKAQSLIGETEQVELKPDKSPVTQLDKKLESALRDYLMAHFPSDGIIGEEFAAYQPNVNRQWVIDPIDGTKAYIVGFATFTTLIALVEGGAPVASVMLQPVTGECWISSDGITSYFADLTKQERQVLKLKHLSETIEAAVFSTTSPLLFRESDKPKILDVASRAKVAQFGGDGYAYGKLSLGQIDLIIESGMQAYDFLPLVPIIENAGGYIRDWQGNKLTMSSTGDVIAASSEHLLKAAIALLNSDD